MGAVVYLLDEGAAPEVSEGPAVMLQALQDQDGDLVLEFIQVAPATPVVAVGTVAPSLLNTTSEEFETALEQSINEETSSPAARKAGTPPVASPSRVGRTRGRTGRPAGSCRQP